MMLNTLLTIISGYIFGSFPSAYIVSRLRRGIDIRDVGTKNVGAMNVLYEVGVAEGILVLVIDLVKGIGAIVLARFLGTSVMPQLFSGAAAVVGHNFPVFLKFRGGKGGATILGILLYLMPRAMPFYLGILALALIFTRNLTFGYSVALATFPFVAWLIYHSAPLVIFSIALLLFLAVNNLTGLRKILREGWRRAILRTSLGERRY